MSRRRSPPRRRRACRKRTERRVDILPGFKATWPVDAHAALSPAQPSFLLHRRQTVFLFHLAQRHQDGAIRGCSGALIVAARRSVARGRLASRRLAARAVLSVASAARSRWPASERLWPVADRFPPVSRRKRQDRAASPRCRGRTGPDGLRWRARRETISAPPVRKRSHRKGIAKANGADHSRWTKAYFTAWAV
jgi:hypothetical protein